MSEEDQGRGWDRIEVWLGPAHLKMLDHIKAEYAGTTATAVRLALQEFYNNSPLKQKNDGDCGKITGKFRTDGA